MLKGKKKRKRNRTRRERTKSKLKEKEKLKFTGKLLIQLLDMRKENIFSIYFRSFQYTILDFKKKNFIDNNVSYDYSDMKDISKYAKYKKVI